MSDDKVSVKEALEKLYDLSWMVGSTAMEYLTDKDGEKIRDYVLPSSIHEVMIIPEEGFEAGELSELVSTCNSELFTEANSEDILSDKVQWCSMDGEILRRAENE
jgi:hypothetical protein